MARKKVPNAPPDEKLKAELEEKAAEEVIRIPKKGVTLTTLERVIATPSRPPGYEGRCGATKSNGKLCLNKPAFPGTMLGGGRCKFHGGLSTGVTTAEGLKAARQAGIRHGAFVTYKNWDEYKRSKYSAQEIAVIDQVPSTPDLSDEIKAQRLKIEHLETNRIQAFNKVCALDEASMEAGGGAQPTPNAFGLTRNSVTGELCHNGVSIQRWVEMENLARDVLRKLMHTQKDINPTSRAKGNLRVNISITGEAAEARAAGEEVPLLEEDTSVQMGTRSLVGSLHDGGDDEPLEQRKDDDVQE